MDMLQSVSAFAPICNPINCPWGKKAFSGYIGDNEEEWKVWDATELVNSATSGQSQMHILVDQGSDDTFLTQKQLLPEAFEKACKKKNDSFDLTLRFQEGYDHSYYFIQTFVNDHLNFHAKYLKQ